MRFESDISPHYLGESGIRYNQDQLVPAHSGHFLQSQFFQPHLKPTDVVLDFGGGNGAIAWHLLCREIYVHDPNPASLTVCQERGLKTISDFGNYKNYFDVVIMNHVLEHIRNPLNALIELQDVIKHGGRLLLMLPLEDWRKRRQRQTDADDADHHLYAWTPRLIVNLLTEAGYDAATAKIVTRAYHPRFLALYRPEWLRPLLMWASAFFFRSRQIWAIGVKKGAERHDLGTTR